MHQEGGRIRAEVWGGGGEGEGVRGMKPTQFLKFILSNIVYFEGGISKHLHKIT